MLRNRFALAVAAGLGGVWLAAGCGASTVAEPAASGGVCEPGKQEPCSCAGGLEGAQRCKDDGSGWDECICGDSGGSGGGSGGSGGNAGGGSGGDGGSAGTGGTPPDAGPDSSVPEAGPDATGEEAGPCVPKVTSVTPITAGLKRPTLFSAAGTCLPSTLTPELANCADMELVTTSATLVEFRCTPSQLGMMTGVLLDEPGGSIVAPVSVEVQYGYPGQSCDVPLTCDGPNGPQSCCHAGAVPGGHYMRGRSLDGTDKCPAGYFCSPNEVPEHAANISAFSLDTYEVTVGRFRKFVEFYDGTSPLAGAGQHPLIPGSGWDSSWNSKLPADKAALLQTLTLQTTYTVEPGVNENHPITKVDWYLTFAFCVWDGGRLPTEAEWEFAAAGGEENRLFPWGEFLPTNHFMKTTCGSVECDPTHLEPVGSHAGDKARWGHVDMGGGAFERTLDGLAPECAFQALTGPCNDCACLNDTTSRWIRGGSVGQPALCRAAGRIVGDTAAGKLIGLRCAR